MKIGLSDGVTFRGNHVHHNEGPGIWCDMNCRNVVYETNIIELNKSAGIFYEISSKAIIRDNQVRHNGFGERVWFWGSDIQVASSEDVEVRGNTLSVSEGGCGIMLIDQSRPNHNGGKYRDVKQRHSPECHDV